MAARKKPPAPKAMPGGEPLLTYPVGVLFRDMDDKVFYLTLAQLEPFRRRDLESRDVRADMDSSEKILGLKNAWLIEGFAVRSGE